MPPEANRILTPEVDRKRPGAEVRPDVIPEVYRARAKVRIGTDMTQEVDCEWFGWSRNWTGSGQRNVFSPKASDLAESVTDVTPEVD